MTCKQHELDLSLNLDGRLPPGRRSALLEHVQECRDCARTLREMQRAQDLALNLPVLPTGTGFRQTLWERIRAGEGAPEQALTSPVPWTTKVRWLLSGAVAAAALLVAASLWLRKTDPGSSPVQPVREDQAPAVARADHELVAEVPQPLPLQPTFLAQSGAAAAADSARRLQGVLRRIEQAPQPPTYDEIRADLREGIEEFTASARLMRWMHDERLIELPTTTLEQLGRVEGSIASLERARSIDGVSIALRPLATVRSDLLHGEFKVWCCKGEREFLLKFEPFYRRFAANNPGAHRLILSVELAPEEGRPGAIFLTPVRRGQ
jgi:hypothetical protein